MSNALANKMKQSRPSKKSVRKMEACYSGDFARERELLVPVVGVARVVTRW